MQDKPVSGKMMAGLMVGALGVVYGDIGTSPLYALRECFNPAHGVAPDRENILGVLSLIFWSLALIVSFKYLFVVVHASNKGEGGILALLSLALPERAHANRRHALIIALGVFGAALLYGDGIITPAITVLGAIEGLEVATPRFQHFILPITLAILIAIFSLQRVGTGRVGGVFGPITLVWFIAIAALGLRSVAQTPEVLGAVNPAHGLHFLLVSGKVGFVVLGAVFLVVTGAEALYADMGHFGRRPIQYAWFGIVWPALLLNYLGQGALLMRDGKAIDNPFYMLAPQWALLPLVVLATMASIIASQALISGAYSLTMQAVQLGYLPRMEIRHTSSHTRGQIYMPNVNWSLMLACLGLVIGFGSSSNLAAAYGIAVTLTMSITSVLFYFAAQRLWGWRPWQAGGLFVVFLSVELAFFGANMLKVRNGGWFPLVVGLFIFTLMTTWKSGRRILQQRLQASTLPWEAFIQDVEVNPPRRVPGTAVFMSGNPGGTPLALLHNLKHNKVLHERVVLLTIVPQDTPLVEDVHQLEVEKLPASFWRVTGRYGFMDEPDVPELLRSCTLDGKAIEMSNTTFFLSRETIIPSANPGMALWREHVFAVMSRNAQPATAFFHLPVNRVVELGMQVEL